MMIAPRPRAVERATAARTCEAFDISRPSSRNPAIKPAVPPVHQPEAIDLPVITWGFDQTLTASTLETPDPRERGVEGKLHLVLQIEIRSRKPRQQLRHIGR